MGKLITVMIERGISLDTAVTQEIFDRLMTGMPTYWDGRDSIRFMRESGCNNWRQMEWAGFYFQFMCERILGEDGFFEIPGDRYGNVEFDGFQMINYDFKAHSHFYGCTSKVPTNGYMEVAEAIRDYGTVGFIVACGNVEFDDQRGSFKNWHDNFKGRISNYEIERIERGASSRRRKTSFNLQEIVFLFVDIDTLAFTGDFQRGMRNSNGTPRNPKVMIDINDDRFERHIYRVRP